MAVHIYNTNSNTLLSGTSGNDSIQNGGYWNSRHGGGDEVTINAGAGNDSIHNYEGLNVKIDGGAGNDTITNYEGLGVKIDGGAGNDYVYNRGWNVTITGGEGNDSIYNNWSFSTNKAYADSYGSNVMFQYNADNGNDIIYGFKTDSTLSVGGGSYSTTKSGSDIVVKVGTGAVTLVGAANLSKVNIKGTEGIAETNSWKVSGTTATYGTSSKTLITITGVKSGTSTSNFKLSGKTVTLKAAALSTSKVTISGDYKLALADDVQKSKTTSAKWTKSNGIAKYISAKTSAGYKLANNAKSISYIYGSGGQQIIKITGLKNNASTAGIHLSDKIVTVSANAVADGKTVSVTGAGYKFNLNGTSGRNTLQGGAGNDTLTGGGGADTFIYTGGNDVITDYTAQDKIKISASYTGKISGNDVILTIDGETLKILNAANKNITINGVTKNFSDDDNDLPTGLTYNAKKKVLIVGSDFTAGEIDLSKYTSAYDVDAHNCERINLKITGNNFNNSLVGGNGSDTISGGAGDDTLTGGGGRDIFVYSGGNDYITDYTALEDKIKLKNTTFNDINAGENDIVITTSTGILTLVKATGKKIKIIDENDQEIEQRYSANISEIIAEKSVGEFEFEFESKITTQEMNESINSRPTIFLNTDENTPIW